MAITPEEKQELIQDVINEITTQSTSIDELDVVNSVSLVDSLPAYKRDTSTLVKVPIPLISKPATDAAVTANAAAEKANTAAQNADAAKQAADEATTAAIEAKEAAEAATTRTIEVAGGLETAINEISTKANDADKLSKKLSQQLGDYTIAILTEEEYEALEEKDENTLYFCTENEETA